VFGIGRLVEGHGGQSPYARSRANALRSPR
jgi:hypothetical protein